MNDKVVRITKRRRVLQSEDGINAALALSIHMQSLALQALAAKAAGHIKDRDMREEVYEEIGHITSDINITLEDLSDHPKEAPP